MLPFLLLIQLRVYNNAYTDEEDVAVTYTAHLVRVVSIICGCVRLHEMEERIFLFQYFGVCKYGEAVDAELSWSG